MKKLRLAAPAKINLVLEVLRRRPDGYHAIRTVMHTLALSDTLEISGGPGGIAITCDHPQVPTDSGNLVHRAAALLAREAGIVPAVHIHITKRIPVAAGMGGGSSDAAAALRGLCRFWKLSLSLPRLRQLAAQLGSDVPFLLTGGCALGTGRGERIFPWPAVPGLSIALINPGFAVPTAEVYKSLNLQLTSTKNYINLMRPAVMNKNPVKIGQNLFNQLETVTLKLHPVLKRIKQELLDCGATAVLMSGSGPTVFGLLPTRGTGEKILKKLGPKYPFVVITQTAGELPVIKG